jgi:hypothetical protein
MTRTLRSITTIGSLVLAGILATGLLSRCGSSSEALVTSYVTSSNTGDLATFTFNGTMLDATWIVTAPTSGVTSKTLNVLASCATADPIYGSQACTVVSSSCSNGSATCGTNDPPAVGSVFETVQAPGIGLLVLPPNNSQLFVGIIAGTCTSSVPGDYLAIDMGIGQFDTFSLYRVDAAFENILKADFRLAGTPQYAAAGVYYDSSTGSGVKTTGFGCANGIRSFATGGAQFSSTLSENGLFVIDQPSGQGGILAFAMDEAAAISDLAGITMNGFVFPDSSTPMRMSITTGANSGNSVSISSITYDSANPPPAATTLEVFGSATSPFTGNSPIQTVSGGAPWTSANNVLASTYPDMSQVPGLFHIPPPSGLTENILVAALKINGKVLLFGVKTDDRSGGINGVGAVATLTAFPNTGSFIAFQQ